MIRLIPSSLTGRKEQLTFIINLIYVATGAVFVAHDFYFDYLVDGYFSAGSIREVALILTGIATMLLMKMRMVWVPKVITALSLPLIFFGLPVFIDLNYLEMYYINTLLLPVMVLIPSIVFNAKENHTLILGLFVFTLLSNFTCEEVVFRFRTIPSADLDFYNYHFGLFSLAKIIASLFTYLNVTRLFRQNENFENLILSNNQELSSSNTIIRLQKEQIEEQNKTLKENEERLKALDTAKSHFFANISHEFRTPLTLILAPLEKKIEEANGQEKAEFTLMQRNASRLLNLVDQLLDLSRLESGSLKLNLATTDLEPVIASVSSQFRSMAELRKIDFQVQAEPVVLPFDLDKVEKIITNLLSNAFKFTNENGKISISLTRRDADEFFRDGFAEIIVEDNGKGIATENLSRIFDRFYQVDGSATRPGEGAGIGLALTRELVELHNGTVIVKSELNEGSRFMVRLPMASELLNEGEITLSQGLIRPIHLADTGPDEDPGDPREKILIVEDNGDLREFLRRALEKEYFVLAAPDGEYGLRAAVEHVPTLIVSDLMMPRLDGLQLCSMLKNDERTSHVPVILLTAKADVETRLSGLEAGADDYIAKPFVMGELLPRIRNLIENRNRLRKKYSQRIELRPAEIQVESEDDRFMKRALEIVEAHIGDVAFGVEPFAREAGMSQTQLYRKLTGITEYSPNEFIRHIRLHRAADLLKKKAGSVAEIAYQVGITNLSYFSKSFKEKFGVNPSEYQP